MYVNDDGPGLPTNRPTQVRNASTWRYYILLRMVLMDAANKLPKQLHVCIG